MSFNKYGVDYLYHVIHRLIPLWYKIWLFIHQTYPLPLKYNLNDPALPHSEAGFLEVYGLILGAR